ncbi:MAG: glucokinase [Parvularculaceae bacterium]
MKSDVLVADIGGTNARFAVARIDGDAVSLGAIETFRREDYETVEKAAAAFLLAVHAKPSAACFAVAGPITDDIVEFTNSPWVLDLAEMKKRLAFDRIVAVNDFEALAASVRRLGAADFAPVKAGVAERSAPVLVLGPGTGFGQALIVPFGGKDRIVATEGGHVGFSPHDEQEIEVLRFLLRERQRVSIERILSGAGLVSIHGALNAIEGRPGQSPAADEITRAALAGADPLAARTLHMFCAILGSAAGDAVLATGARGGVVLGGGILPRIRDVLIRSAFTARFLDKGRMRGYLEPVPVDLIVRDGAALLGAAVRFKELTNSR